MAYFNLSVFEHVHKKWAKAVIPHSTYRTPLMDVPRTQHQEVCKAQCSAHMRLEWSRGCKCTCEPNIIYSGSNFKTIHFEMGPLLISAWCKHNQLCGVSVQFSNLKCDLLGSEGLDNECVLGWWCAHSTDHSLKGPLTKQAFKTLCSLCIHTKFQEKSNRLLLIGSNSSSLCKIFLSGFTMQTID